jgi:FlaA1/EpsC-like NDP-sugar epimerase
MLANPAVGLRPVGFIDDKPTRAGRAVNGVQIVGTLNELENAIRSLRAETVVVSTRKVPEERVAEARAACERAGIKLVRMQIRFDELKVDDLCQSEMVVSRRIASVGDSVSRRVPPVGQPATESES